MKYLNVHLARCITILLFTVLCCSLISAQQNRQIISCVPEHPNLTEPVSIIYDATQGNGALAYFDGDVYAFTGVTVNGTNWQYANSWDNPYQDKYKFTPIGDNKWKLVMPDGICAFYDIGISETRTIQKLSFLFRTPSDANKIGRGDGDSDIFLDIEKPTQVISSYPEILYDDKQSVKIIFDASQGNAGLKDYQGDIYAHTGVITNESTNDGDWKYGTEWKDNSEKYKLTSLGNNKWQLTMPNGVRDFYGVSAQHTIQKIMFIFRDDSGNTTGRNADYSDISLTLSDLLTTTPSFPFSDQSITISFNPSQGNQALIGYTEDIYAHTGVITNLSNNDSDWRYATDWNTLSDTHKLSSIGNGISQLTINDIRAFYNIPANETIKKLAFVFRNEDGSKVAKTKDDKDILVNIYQPGIATRFETPKEAISIKQGEPVSFIASSSTEANLKLYIDEDSDNPIATASNSNIINTTYQFDQVGEYKLSIEASNGTSIHTSEIAVTVLAQTIRQSKPAKTRPGINYNDNNTSEATLVLQAPYKQNVYVVGDFNNWNYSAEYQMLQDGEYFWITLTGLTPGEEYAFQYVVDGNIRIADPYTDKVLDPQNDPYISESIYPNLKTYPTGKTEGIVSVFQTGQTPYPWKVTNFTKPVKDNLIIYEMHLRDFTEEGSYKAALEKLPYLKTLGINAIELMPVNEFEGNDSWGYNPSFYFAIDKAYGTKNDLKEFIDECHDQGIAVIIDMVLNHSFGQSPLFNLYKGDDGRPSFHNPWYNQQSNFGNPDAQWGVDFNHESEYTRALVDSVAGFWIKEYKVDGIRYDFTKGFSNTPFDAVYDPWGSTYDPGRIYNLKRMSEEVWKRDAKAYVIFEHLTPQNQTEEKELALEGIMMWRNMNRAYSQSAMGYNQNSSFNNLYDWDSSVQMPTNSLVGYMESHDEPRITWEAETYGTDEIKSSLSNRMKQAANNAALFLTVPGPKMIWQFGELGYDYDIDYNGRTGRKPIRWDYYDDENRKMLYDTYSKLLNLRQEYPELFSTRSSDKFQWYVSESNWDTGRKIYCQTDNGKKMSIAANFSGIAQNISVYFPERGTWHEYMSNTTIEVTQDDMNVMIPAYEFRLYINFDPGTRNIYTSDLEPEKLTHLENIRLRGEGWTRKNIDQLSAALQKESLNDKLKEIDLSEVQSMEENLAGLLHNCTSVTNIYLPQGNFQGQILNEMSNPNCFIHLPADAEHVSTFDENWVNVIKDDIAQTDIIITNENPFYLSKQFTVNSGKTVTYTRSFDGAGRDGGWETIWLPFAPASITDSEKGNRIPVAEGQSGNFWLKEYSGSSQAGEVNFINSTSMEANTPYIIAFPGTAWGNQYKNKWDITFTGTDETIFNPNYKATTTEGNFYSYVGITNPIANDVTSPTLYIYNKEDNLFEKADNSQRHFNAYFIDQSGNRSTRSLQMGNGGATGFDKLMDDENELNIYGDKGKLVVETTQTLLIQVFDLSGRIVSEKSLEAGKHSIALPQGIYIANNQKIVIY